MSRTPDAPPASQLPIVLLTPSIVRNPQEARDLTDEYGRRFRSMEPLHTTP